ncbi:RNA-directed DNA polymerase from mobile element jockey [Trichonephila clavipes]|nr:RNA-directed DNA polymerase from mobile element jockey [Trichonephila clavipes]
MDSLNPCSDHELVLPKPNVDNIATNTRFLLISLNKNEMSTTSPFAIHKALIGIGGEPKSVKKLRSSDLLIETSSAVQTKSFLLAKSFLDSPANISPHKSLNSSRGVISEPDLLTTSDAEILEGFSDQGVTQRFGHSQTSCRGQLTCSRCASVGHSSTDCTLEPKCVNCTQSHPSDSKLCQKWKLEKQIQEIKTNKNISYFEARRLIVPQLTQTYAQATKPSAISTATQTDPNISNIICPPLQCLTPISSKNPLPNNSSSVSTISTSSSSTQDNLLPSPSGILPTIQSESLLQIPIPTTSATTTSPGNNLNPLVSPLETETRSHTTPAKLNSVSTENLSESVPNESNSEHSNAAEAQQFVKRKSRNRRKRPKVQKPDIEIKRVPHRYRNATPTEITTDYEDMITYDVEEEELEQDPPNKFTIDEDPFILPKGYLRALTPSRYRNYRE